ncbi:UNVERIFIED_CONTAM: hypothetical protein Sradi_0276400 [Sesamum radiatum]|uniref:Uncharacterized protein n=1 Tax=Sesamum radiatum TaxID=300843 RepID=A0AAW2W1Z8_SESRA
MEEFLQIRRFELIPSAEEFASRIEPKNVPAVFSGCVKDWKAFSKWNVLNGGLDYLQVLLPFSTFIGYCKDLLRNGDDGQDSFSQLRKQEPVELVTQNGDSINAEEHPHRIYLAQVPIVNAENEEKVLLESLREDIETGRIEWFVCLQALWIKKSWMQVPNLVTGVQVEPKLTMVLC